MNFRPRHRLPRGGNYCDFCGATDVRSLYACLNFMWEDHAVFSHPTGRWAACWICSTHIEVQEWGQLNRRVMREVAKRQGITAEEIAELRATLKVLHALFAKHVVSGSPLKIHHPRTRRFMLDT